MHWNPSAQFALWVPPNSTYNIELVYAPHRWITKTMYGI